MKKSQLLIIIALMTMLLWINLISDDLSKSYFGGLPWYGWAGITIFLVIAGFWFAVRDAERARRLLEEPVAAKKDDDAQVSKISPEDLKRLDPDSPNYPHPVIFPERCIGCHACVDACPHDVLAIVNGIASPVASDQCMEDTACQVECPVNPKACIVVNTTKKIRPRPVPVRDPSFMTNVPGCYIIGDVSGTPLIKNAANEGADAVKHIARELNNGAGAEPKAGVDVAIIGIGPAGLSAAIAAKQFRLTLGYPVVNGQWKWKGLDPEELANRPKIAAMRLPTDTEQLWRNKQFHALHIYNVKATGSITGVTEAEAGSPPVLSCSSCHSTYKDRESPRKTCGQCHSGSADPSGRVVIAAGAPNCVSCHVQHVKDKRHWNPDLLAESPPKATKGK